MLNLLFSKRFSLVKTFSASFLTFAFIIRLVLYIWSFENIEFSFFNLIKIFGLGFLFDLGSLSYMMAFYSIYLLLVPNQFYGSRVDKFLTKSAYAVVLFFMLFSFLAELAFWEEYGKRFNFIAVDYLLYTYEVVKNIKQSFHLEIVIAILIAVTYFSVKIAKKKNAYVDAFDNSDTFLMKIIPAFFWIFVLSSFHFNVENSDAEIFANQYENEIAKSGIYSFFAAYDENELNYNDFSLVST
jgi:hypothetical protein